MIRRQRATTEVVAVLGPDGARKTTAVSLMLGLLRPTAGDARLFGGNPQNAINRTRVGAVLQLSGVPDTVTVKEHLTLFSSYYPKPLTGEVLELTGLTGFESRPYGKLSGGQKQRLHQALERLRSAYSGPLILVALRNPYDARLVDVDTYVCAFGFRKPNAQAAAEVLMTGRAPAGELPVTPI